MEVKTNVVLDGARGDGSSWGKVIPFFFSKNDSA
jgi:hypothetical protein